MINTYVPSLPEEIKLGRDPSYRDSAPTALKNWILTRFDIKGGTSASQIEWDILQELEASGWVYDMVGDYFLAPKDTDDIDDYCWHLIVYLIREMGYGPPLAHPSIEKVPWKNKKCLTNGEK